jgi:hypothetical protein
VAVAKEVQTNNNKCKQVANEGTARIGNVCCIENNGDTDCENER